MNKYKKMIKDRGLKITWVAQKIHVKQPELSMWLNETRVMPDYIEARLKLILK